MFFSPWATISYSIVCNGWLINKHLRLYMHPQVYYRFPRWFSRTARLATGQFFGGPETKRENIEMLGYQTTSKEALQNIQWDQERNGKHRSVLLASMHGAFRYDADIHGDHIAFRVCVLICQAMPNLINR